MILLAGFISLYHNEIWLEETTFAMQYVHQAHISPSSFNRSCQSDSQKVIYLSLY